MSRFAELLVKEKLTRSERNDLREIASTLEAVVWDVGDRITTSGRVSNLTAGSVNLTTAGLIVQYGGLYTGRIEQDGDFLFGSDINDPAKTSIVVLSNAQTYNSESLGAGDLLLGDNSASKANMLWDASAGKLQFRGGQTMQCEIGTDGTLIAGGGNVVLSTTGIVATSGEIGGWVLGATSLTAASGVTGLSSEVTGGTDWRFWAGNATPGSAPFRVDESGNLYATAATLTGSITATSGAIGGWDIGATTLSSGSTNIVLDSSNKALHINDTTFGNAGIQLEYNAGTPRFYMGDGSDDYFQYDGAVLTLNGCILSAIATGSELALQGWQFDSIFSATDLDTVAWSSGTLTFVNSDGFSIVAGNTGNMAATTYIYFDKATSETVLQTSTTAGDAVGVNKVLICVAKNSTNDALFQVFGGTGGILIGTGNLEDLLITTAKIVDEAVEEAKIGLLAVTSAKIGNLAVLEGKLADAAVATAKLENEAVTSDKILANTIVAGDIAANTITAAEIFGDTITANEIAANTITSAEIFANTIVAGDIAGNTITAAEIAATTITAAEIFGGTITTTEIAATTILAGNIAANTITANEIAATTITANEIAANTITSGQINTGAVDTDELAANAVTAVKINVSNLSAINADLGTITAGVINMFTGTWDADATGFRLTTDEIASQSSGVDQVVISGSGLTAGAGEVTLNSDGIRLVVPINEPNIGASNTITIVDSTSNMYTEMASWKNDVGSTVEGQLKTYHNQTATTATTRLIAGTGLDGTPLHANLRLVSVYGTGTYMSLDCEARLGANLAFQQASTISTTAGALVLAPTVDLELKPGGNVGAYISTTGNFGIGATSFGTSATWVFAQKRGITPGSSPTDVAQMWVADVAAGIADFKVRTEAGVTGRILNVETTAYHNAAVTISNNTLTTLALNNELNDDEGGHDNVTNNSRITVTEAGTYLFIALAYWEANATGDRQTFIRRYNSSDADLGSIAQMTIPAATLSTDMSVVGIRIMDAGDYAVIRVLQTSGGDLDVEAYCKLSVIKLK